MTTLVALHTPGFGTVIGSDRRVTSSHTKMELLHPKWAFCGDWAIGTSGSLRVLNVLQDVGEKLLSDCKNPMEVTWRLTTAFPTMGINPGNDGESGGANYWGGNQFLLANPHGVWEIDPILSVVAVRANMLFSVGSGASYALGCAGGSSLTDPIERCHQALTVAGMWDPHTGGENWVHHIQPLIKKAPVRKIVLVPAIKMSAKKRVAK